MGSFCIEGKAPDAFGPHDAFGEACGQPCDEDERALSDGMTGSESPSLYRSRMRPKTKEEMIARTCRRHWRHGTSYRSLSKRGL